MECQEMAVGFRDLGRQTTDHGPHHLRIRKT